MRSSKNNIVVFTITIGLMVFSVWLGNGGLANASLTTKVKGISADLENALDRVLNVENVSFTPIPMNNTIPYNSSTAYYPVGMTGLYNITNIIIEFIMAKEPLPPGLYFTNCSMRNILIPR